MAIGYAQARFLVRIDSNTSKEHALAYDLDITRSERDLIYETFTRCENANPVMKVFLSSIRLPDSYIKAIVDR